MISKEEDNKKSTFLWTSNIFIIPNDLSYQANCSKNNKIKWENVENKSDSDSNSEKIFFTELLKPNWKKHINNYVRRKFSGYRKKIRKIFD
jgi:hypothetical protein